MKSRAMTGPPTQMAAKNMMEAQRSLCLGGASRLAERASGLHNYYIHNTSKINECLPFHFISLFFSLAARVDPRPRRSQKARLNTLLT